VTAAESPGARGPHPGVRVLLHSGQQSGLAQGPGGENTGATTVSDDKIVVTTLDIDGDGDVDFGVDEAMIISDGTSRYCAQIEAINRQFNRQIEAATESGDNRLADLLKRLRDLQVEAVGERQTGGRQRREAEFQQVSLSRTSLGGGDQQQQRHAEEARRQRDQMIKEQQRTNRQLKDREPARAG